MSWFDDVERHVHSRFPAKPQYTEHDALDECVQNYYPNVTRENVADLVCDILEKWDEFEKRHITFSGELVQAVRHRVIAGEDCDSIRNDLLRRGLSLPQTDEIVGRAILTAESAPLLSSKGWLLGMLAELPLGHSAAVDICRTLVNGLGKPPTPQDV